MAHDLFSRIKTFIEEAQGAELADKEAAEQYRLLWLGKKGHLTGLYAQLKELPNDQKKEAGAAINLLRQTAEQKLREASERLEAQQGLAKKGPRPDLTLPAMSHNVGGRHPLSIVRNKIYDIFHRQGFVTAYGPEITDDWHNFTALNIPEDHPARDMQDSFFIKDRPDLVLRTHTSPVQVATMLSQPPPIKIISPGRVYRRDNDATHSPVFHQVEGLYIDLNVSFADLKQALYLFVEEMFGADFEIRFRPSFFPFTEPSAEMDIRRKGEDKWMEILGCGMVDPAVLENCNIDSEIYTGYAFGLGIERIAMLKYGIRDIRLFYENHHQFLSQFTNTVL